MPTMRAERAERTREQIPIFARRMFADVGYTAASTTEIATAAGAGTRGALYHHFEDKAALFAAVFEDALKELSVRHVEPAARMPATGLDRLRGMVDSFLDSSLDTEVRQNRTDRRTCRAGLGAVSGDRRRLRPGGHPRPDRRRSQRWQHSRDFGRRAGRVARRPPRPATPRLSRRSTCCRPARRRDPGRRPGS